MGLLDLLDLAHLQFHSDLLDRLDLLDLRYYCLLGLRDRLFLRRLGPWLEHAVERIILALKSWGVRFVTAGEQARALLGP